MKPSFSTFFAAAAENLVNNCVRRRKTLNRRVGWGRGGMRNTLFEGEKGRSRFLVLVCVCEKWLKWVRFHVLPFLFLQSFVWIDKLD